MNSMKTILSATAVSALLASPALADCPSGHVPAAGGAVSIPSVSFGVNAFSIGGGVPQNVFDSGPQTDANCVTAGALSIGGAPAVTGAWQVVDPANTPNDPSDDVSVYLPPASAVLGQNSTALGNRATVGRIETYIDDKGDDDPTNDTEETRIVPVNDGTAIGANASVQHNGSTAVGAGAKSTAENQVTLGTAKDTIKAEGITSQKSKDRQAGPLEVVTSDSQGNLATDGGAIYGHLSQHDAALASQQSQINRLNGKVDDAFEGVAIALAMESPQVDPGKRFGISLNWGNFEGENALAAAAKLRFDNTWAGTAGVGYGLGQNTLGVRAGIQAQW